MIPLKLQIKNFLSYGSQLQEINFEPYNLICLSGRNGHGKSALLDAMTWAIWGQARKISGTPKPDQGLIRLGQTEMVVIFDFLFNKNKYRVRRDLNFSFGKMHANLEFAIFESEDKLSSLTDKTISATQNKIESMIGLSYDSFINSAFLKQGSSNEFSKKSAKDRKAILCSILGLDKFENLRKRALDKIKNSTSEKDSALKLFEHLEKDLSTFDETNIKLIGINQQIDDLHVLQQNYFSNKISLDNQKNQLLNQLQEYKLFKLKFSELNEEFEKQLDALKTARAQWKETLRAKINFNIETLKAKKEELLKNIKIYQLQYEQKLEFKEKYLKIKEQEQNLLNKLSAEFNKEIQDNKVKLQNIFNENKFIHEKININNKQISNNANEIINIENQINLLSKDSIAIDENKLSIDEKQFEKRKAFYQKFIAKGNLLKTEIEQLSHKQRFSIDEQNPSCPLCQQNLSASRKKFLKQQFSNQEQFAKHRFKRISKIITSLKELLLVQNEKIKNENQLIEKNKILKIKIEQLLNAKKTLENQRLEINKNINQLNEELITSQQHLDKQKIKIDELENKLKNIDQISQEYKNLVLLLNEIKAKSDQINYDQQMHKDAIAQAQKIELELNSFSSDEQTKLLMLKIKSEVTSICTKIKVLKNSISDLNGKLNNFNNIENLSVQLVQKEQQLLESIKKLSEQKDVLLHEKGSLENQKNKLEKLAIQYQKQTDVIKDLNDTIDEYKIISLALSKDGIQALLIEDAIPEIEHEANELLSKLTDNQSQIFIESLRDLKKGGTKETLDIKISDSSGIRPYEMFSGGEAFRIDFALRISISKLLARRAGTSLQTLIIDEGFGSQDEDGIALIMDCIHKIQEDFSKVIIVSHLPTMKDNFPVHFVVEKLSSGSHVTVLENG